jgi:hypothetical protein
VDVGYIKFVPCSIDAQDALSPFSSLCCLMRAAAGTFSNIVDFYNSATGAWTTAQLSSARVLAAAAASVGNIAIFAGGCVSNPPQCWCISIYTYVVAIY